MVNELFCTKENKIVAISPQNESSVSRLVIDFPKEGETIRTGFEENPRY